MIVKNPTDKDIEMTFKGIVYKVAANGSLKNVPSDVADDWKTRTHEFIIVEPDTVASTPKVEVKKEESVEVKAEVKEEVVAKTK